MRQTDVLRRRSVFLFVRVVDCSAALAQRCAQAEPLACTFSSIVARRGNQQAPEQLTRHAAIELL